VQPFPSSQFIAAPAQTPLEQASLPVQALPSSQTAVLLLCMQAPAEQESSVQAFPSSQFIAVPAQTPLEQASFPVQALPSSQVVPSSFPEHC